MILWILASFTALRSYCKVQKARVLNSSQTKYFLIDRVTLYISERYFKGILMGLYTNKNKSQFTYNAY